MPSFRTFNNVTDSSLLFTNIGVYEADLGNTADPSTSFITSAPEPLGVPGSLTLGMQWTLFSARLSGANSQKTLDFSYDVTNTDANQLITSFNSLYNVDIFNGPGVSMTAVERVYDMDGNLLGSQTFVKGLANPAAVTFAQGHQQIRVTLSIIEAIDATGDATSVVDMSLIRQTFSSTPLNQLCTIGDYVWIDLNANGVQDDGIGASGVTVHLTNADGSQILATTTTDLNGLYLFDRLVAGTYAIKFDAVDGFLFTTPGLGGNSLLDSDANTITGQTTAITLTAGQIYTGLDAGLVIDGTGSGTLGSVGNYVWLDADQDGIQDGDESGLGGVTVNLLNSLGAVIGTDITEADGSYSFVNLQAGTYQVEFVGLTGYGRTVANATGDTADSDADIGTGKTSSFTLAAGEVNNTVDAGMYVLPASVGNYVWVDADQDGIQDSNEAGLANVTVNLLNGAGVVIGTDVTDGSGFYEFTGLTAGTYQVEFVTPTDYGLTTTDANLNLSDDIDSDADIGTGKTASFTLAAGEANTTIDAGMYLLPASIGNYVWVDADQDGIQDANESGLVGVTVNLLNSSGGVIGTDITDSNGFYSFDNLAAGTYQVQFVTPTYYIRTTANVGMNLNDNVDSDANVSTGLTAQFVLSAGQYNDTIDAGMIYCPPATASIGNFVWYDCDNDGIQDTSETGLSGVTVRLMAADGTTVLSTTSTNTNGFYQFSGLAAGTYQVHFGTKTGYQLTTANVGTNDAIDSDANATTRLSGPIVLDIGENDTTVDAGMIALPAALGNYVWLDTDQDGIQDSTELGLGGVTVNLLNSAGAIIGTRITDTFGAYSFTDLAPGTYQVKFNTLTNYVLTTANAGTNDFVDSDATVSTGLTQQVTLSAGETNNSLDAGMVYSPAGLGSISNFVWYDLNKNGKQDSGETGISGVTVNLMAADGTTVLSSTTTDSSGFYQFSNLAAGTYQVYFGTKSGYQLTAANVGTNDAIDSDAHVLSRLSGPIVLDSGENDTTVDAGMIAAQLYGGLTPGFWGAHKNAWDGIADTKYANLVRSGVLSATDVLFALPNQGKSGPGGEIGVLLGDSNRNGVQDSGENTLFVSLKAAQQLIASSVAANDTRQILTRHALAAQLNINNGDKSPGGMTVGADLISKAVSWLKGSGPFIYSDGSSGKIDTNVNGVLTAGTTGTIEYNTITAAFTSTILTSNKMAWQQQVAMGFSPSDFYVSGEELKNGLQAFNENQLVTSADGSLVGWNNGGGMTNAHTNNASGMWTVLRDAGIV